jgi:hypothetical protein
MVGARDLAGGLVDLDDARALVDQRGQLALRRGERSCRTAWRLRRKVWSAGRASAFSAWNWLIWALRLAKLGRQTLHLVFEEVERAFGAPGPQLHIGGDDPGDVFVDHIGGDLPRPRLEAHGDDGGLVAAARLVIEVISCISSTISSGVIRTVLETSNSLAMSSRLARVSRRSRMIVISSSATWSRSHREVVGNLRRFHQEAAPRSRRRRQADAWTRPRAVTG